ncbi:hypothetical protein [Blautia sp.]|uniref:hypothetical protein n=1 Tax=Blautia sp. TaxID=1955243 RepID=UPI00280A8104|nr:hypothetical protein [Blautia sp.]MED9883563.1 hypothetical protein [Blautia sp.]
MENGTIFDDVFRTMLEKMPYLAIPLINEVFGTSYPEDIEIIQKRNEHQTQNGRIITDSHLLIANRIYHIECQSTDDATMVIRMIEYDFAISLENVQRENGRYRMYFPQSCVLYLRGTKRKDTIAVELVMPNGNTVEYTVPAVQVQRFTCNDMLQKHLLFLLPYYVIKYEHEKRLDTDSRKWKQFLEEYAEIEKYLKESFLEKGNEKAYCDMIELIIRVADYVFRDKENVRKGFGDVMGGKVLELESDKLIQRGIEQGIAMERKKTELERQKAEAEIQRLKKLLEEKNNKQ